MPSYNVLYKTLADDDGWESGLAPFLPDRNEALALFNTTTAREKNLGQFTFDESGPPSDYILIEIVKTSTGGDEKILYRLFEKR